MPKPRKRDILGETWEYTLLRDDFTTFDNDANGVTPSAGTMVWRGHSYPAIVNEISPSIQKDGSSGPWWLPDEMIWEDDRLLLNILRKAYFMECVPIVKDHLLMDCSDIEVLRREQIYIPRDSSSAIDVGHGILFRQLMQKVTICHNSEKEHAFTELVNALRTINVAREDANKYNICLVKFPYRIWPEGLSHMRIHPIIVIPTDVFRRYHH